MSAAPFGMGKLGTMSNANATVSNFPGRKEKETTEESAHCRSQKLKELLHIAKN